MGLEKVREKCDGKKEKKMGRERERGGEASKRGKHTAGKQVFIRGSFCGG